MARGPASKRSSAKKTPATKKRASAAPPAKKAAKKAAKRASAAPRGAKATKGKPKQASTKSAKGAGAEEAAHSAVRVMVQNVNVPGYTTSVDGAKYAAMRDALMKVLPSSAPGLTQAEMVQAVRSHLPAAHFPGGAKAEWWAKCVQLDLEAKRAIAREASKPLRWHKA